MASTLQRCPGGARGAATGLDFMPGTGELRGTKQGHLGLKELAQAGPLGWVQSCWLLYLPRATYLRHWHVSRRRTLGPAPQFPPPPMLRSAWDHTTLCSGALWLSHHPPAGQSSDTGFVLTLGPLHEAPSPWSSAPPAPRSPPYPLMAPPKPPLSTLSHGQGPVMTASPKGP